MGAPETYSTKAADTHADEIPNGPSEDEIQNEAIEAKIEADESHPPESDPQPSEEGLLGE